MNHDDLNELAALSAFELLGESECGVLEDAIAQSPELGEKLTQLQDAAAAIGYSAPIVPMASDLKERLFQRIATAVENTEDVATSPDLAHLTQQASRVTWQPYSLPGVIVGTLHIDTNRREIACFLRAEAGVQFPYHSHAGNEEIVVLEGDLIIGDRVYRTGECILSHRGSAHKPKTSGGCLLFLRTSLDDRILS
ncbi:cupin domain-containing protein [Chroococcidiopsis sp. TS-821]|uniref:cupin domain-containing protein n=1 Tax=Chroococcidiopsis sp. TS-821 TaxID=1378066 RepID=UPI000CEF2AC1|nr:cupin domain-containing protein [Chroococcidiopsis sp. TS-821]PPS41012.1 hypothetical protein B1A85_19100 [Chroococcidiopsis sp. TS-821]